MAGENFDISLLGHAALWLVVIVSIHNVLIRAESDNKSCSYTCTIHIPMEEKQKIPADSGCKI